MNSHSKAFPRPSTETKQPFQLTYNKGALRTQSVGLTRFNADFYPKFGGGLDFYFYTYDHSLRKHTWMAIYQQSLKSSSFIVEGLPDDTPEIDCMRSENPLLKPTYCTGAIRLRNLEN